MLANGFTAIYPAGVATGKWKTVSLKDLKISNKTRSTIHSEELAEKLNGFKEVNFDRVKNFTERHNLKLNDTPLNRIKNSDEALYYDLLLRSKGITDIRVT